MRPWFRQAIVAGVLLLAGCPEPTIEVAPKATLRVSRPEVMLGGCLEETAQRCLLPTKPTVLTLWVDTHAAAQVQIEIDEAAVEVAGVAVDGGLQLEVRVPVDAERLRLHGTNPAWAIPLEISFERVATPAWLARADALIAENKLDEAAEELEAGIVGAEGATKLRALDTLRRVEYRRGRPKHATALEDRALALAIETNARRTEAILLSARADRQIVVEPQLREAAKTLEHLFVLGDTDNVALSHAEYWAGHLDLHSGNVDGALKHFATAHPLAERLGDRKHLTHILEFEAITLGDLGRGDEALEVGGLVLALARDPRVDRCDRLSAARNFAWTQLVLAASGLPHDPPRAYLLEVLDLYEGCPDPTWEHANAMVNLALAELADARPDDALGWLSRIEAVPSDLEPWIEEIQARAAVDSLDRTQEPSLLRMPAPTADTQLQWNALVRSADAAARWGIDGVALADYAAAEKLLDAQLGKVRIAAGAELFLAGRSASAQGLVELLLERGQTAEALCAARLARGRAVNRLDRVARLSAASDEARERWNAAVFEVLDEGAKLDHARRETWRLSAAERASHAVATAAAAQKVDATLDHAVRGLGLPQPTRECGDLRTPADGVVVLHLFPLRSDWVVFAVSSTALRSVIVDEHALFDPGNAWLSAFDALVSTASRVVVVPTGEAWTFRIHEATFRGEPLIAAAPVVYSLDLPERAPPTEPRAAALVVGDPSGNLPLARTEASAAAHALSAAGWSVDTLLGATTTRRAVESALSEASLLHYAGHGIRNGVTGWDSALLLADGAQLGVRDILALPKVPAGVVLTGCDTASSAPNTLDGGMNLARAFVLAGAEWVVAADEEVADALAAAMGSAMHRSDTAKPDWMRAAQQAQLEVRAQQPDSSWGAFRVIVP